jgi:hypothetical protein
MNKAEIIRYVGITAMFFGGYMGSQSIWWGWVSAVLGLGVIVLALWMQNRK